MASSKVMASSGSANSDLARQPSIYSRTVPELQNGQKKKFGGSMNMDELLRNMYGDNPAAEMIPPAGSGSGEGQANGAAGMSSLATQGSFTLPKSHKPVDEVWKEIAASGGDRKIRAVEEGQYFKDPAIEQMTLEDFLAKAGAVREEDVRIPQVSGAGQGVYPVDPLLANRFPQQQLEGSIAGFGNGVEGGAAVGVGRGKRRIVEEPIDKAAQQRQRRMIKNRESAARSRERKQAYTVELESLVAQLEEENARLLKEQAEQTKKRFMQLMEYVIPVEEKRRPPRVLRRIHSVQW
ncbi:PREDICTED: G-box-binding factor 4-like isoform X2 [Nelumbo nucifera]|uniref:G-box-binding factor 4-like isoform X2 n=1 Tax=Nelumbo nucifera TaxID=4432 RepID=A0A1U7YRR5_NELNU|nr:PREDICTED: G-box-binding factor 4-like isoform X2 [Nelumbo nucifera]